MIRFWRSESGNVAVIFTLAAIPAIGLIGASVDYGRKSHALSQMQIAVDSAALALSKLPNTTPQAEIEAKAAQYFNANFKEPAVNGVQLAVTPGKGVLSLSATATMTPQVTILSSVSSMPLAASATVKWGIGKLRVALALDVTGSMNSAGKLPALKTATKGLLDQLQAAAVNDGDVEVAIIPFSELVNVGTANKNATWLDWNSTSAEYGTCSKNSSTNVSRKRCTDAGGAWTLSTNKSNWKGCVTDRGLYTGPNPATTGSGYDQLITAPDTSVVASKFPPASPSLDDYCPATTMIGLNHSWSSLESTVDSLIAGGATNQPLGLVWAWQALAGGGPLTVPAKDPDYKYNEAIVLLSDGLNTRNRWKGNGSSTSTDVDKRMYDSSSSGKGTCANIKAQGITIYTIQVNTGNDAKSKLLQNCASDSKKFYYLTSSSEMVSVFNEIASDLANLYISE
ncbi:MAG: TadE/TadG family protein [Bacteroidales bacterium]|nr:TadE/TadG family protein [Bacteroidales bacterium]